MKWGSLNVFSFHKMQGGIVFSPESGCLATSHCWQVHILQQYVNGMRRNKIICNVSRLIFQYVFFYYKEYYSHIIENLENREKNRKITYNHSTPKITTIKMLVYVLLVFSYLIDSQFLTKNVFHWTLYPIFIWFLLKCKVIFLINVCGCRLWGGAIVDSSI